MADSRSKRARVATADRLHPTRVTMPIAAADSEPVAAPRMSQPTPVQNASRFVHGVSRASAKQRENASFWTRSRLISAFRLVRDATRRSWHSRHHRPIAAPTVKVGLPHFMPSPRLLFPSAQILQSLSQSSKFIPGSIRYRAIIQIPRLPESEVIAVTSDVFGQ